MPAAKAVCPCHHRLAPCWRVVPNLARGMCQTASTNSGADITYIRCRKSSSISPSCLMPLAARGRWPWKRIWTSLRSQRSRCDRDALPTPGSLIHHSDRGTQYACHDYTELLHQHDIAASMSRVAIPTTMPSRELHKTLKQEEVNGQTYRDATMPECHRAFIEEVYNANAALALAYRPPAEFSKLPRAGCCAAAPHRGPTPQPASRSCGHLTSP